MSKKYTDKEVEQIIVYALSFNTFYRKKKLKYPCANIDELAELFLIQQIKDDFKILNECKKGNPLEVRCEEPSPIGRELVNLVNDIKTTYNDVKKWLRDTSYYLFAGSLPERYRKRICEQEGWDEHQAEIDASGIEIVSGSMVVFAGYAFSSLLLLAAGLYATADAFFRDARNPSLVVKYIVTGIEKIKQRELFPEKQPQQLPLIDLYNEEPEAIPVPEEIQISPELIQTTPDIIFPEEEFPSIYENVDEQKQLLIPKNEHLQKAKQIVTEIEEKIGKSIGSDGKLYLSSNSKYASVFTGDNGLMLTLHALFGEQQKAENLLSTINKRIGKLRSLYKREEDGGISLNANASMMIALSVLGKQQEAEHIYANIHTQIGRIRTLYLSGVGEGKIYTDGNALMVVVHSLFDHKQEAKKIVTAIEEEIGMVDATGKGALYLQGHNDYAIQTGPSVAMALAYEVIGDKERSVAILKSVDDHMEKDGVLSMGGLAEERFHTSDNAIMAILCALQGGAKRLI